jgi:hypothetical protein
MHPLTAASLFRLWAREAGVPRRHGLWARWLRRRA